MFGNIDLRAIPVPTESLDFSTLDQKDVPVKSINASSEQLVRVSSHHIASESYYARDDGLNPPYYRGFTHAPREVWCRKGVAEKLEHANAILEAYGSELFVLDGYRPIEIQVELWEYFMGIARQTLKGATEDELIRFAGQYCSDPNQFEKDDPSSWPSHVTGGAVDVTLKRQVSGEHLYMGGVFDDASEISHTAYFECSQNNHSESRVARASIAEARKNRRLLYWAMTLAGFANYPYEWWHFDWGTRMWVNNRLPMIAPAQNYAFYGPAVIPEGQTV